jgi:photosystem II stability/assembly factor-like uncharacterized protein
MPGLPSPLSLAFVSYSLSFVTPEVGYLLGSGTDVARYPSAGSATESPPEVLSFLWGTSNGGHTWRTVAAHGLAPGAGILENPAECGSSSWLAIAFATSGVGFVSDACDTNGPHIWETTDGGRDWRRARFEPPPGGWPQYAQFGQPTITADGGVLETASGLDRATDEDGWLVVERLGVGGSFSYVGRVQTDGLMMTPLDPIDQDGSRLAVVVSGRLASEGDELFESSDGGTHWRLTGHEPDASPGTGPNPPSLSELSEPVDDGALAVVRPPGGAGTNGAAHASAARALLLTSGAPALQWQDNGGAVYLTKDHGGSWRRVLTVAATATPLVRYGEVAFATERVGYLAGTAAVAVTVDGGAHLLPVLRLRGKEQLLGLDVIGRSSAVVLTSRRLLATSDLGLHWQVRRAPTDLTSIEAPSIRFASTLVGFSSGCAIGGRPSLERTVDGGRSWQALPVPAGSGCNPSPSVCVASARLLYDLVAPQPPPFPGAGGDGPYDSTLYLSENGGSSWRRIGKAPHMLLACQGATLWAESAALPAAGFEPYMVFRSRNGGRSFAAVGGSVARWRRGDAPVTPGFGDLDTLIAFGSDAAVAVTDCQACQGFGELYVSATSDDGAHWSPLKELPTVGVSYSPGSVSFVSPRHGFVLGPWLLGPGYVLVATSDGGRTWRQVAVLGSG